MKRNLSLKETVFVASMLFGLFFGAGNLIFPLSMGQLAARDMWPAVAGFLITGVGLPLLGVAALGVSRKSGLLELSSTVGKKYGMFFTCALYLTIGPFFAIPRCASVSYTIGLENAVGQDGAQVALALFSAAFFLVTLYFSLRPGEILKWVGKFLNPLFLACLAVLIVAALAFPMGSVSAAQAQGAYAEGAFFTGFLEGYNTMDALAGLAFGIIVVDVIRRQGVTEPSDVARNTVRAGLLSSLLMAVIYVLVTMVGAQSRGVFPAASNGGEAFLAVANHYFGAAGSAILAVTVAVACLKTSIGLVTSCAETFERMFSKGPSYRVWAVAFCAVSFLIANLGLNAIISYSLPVLMLLYPLAVVLILLTLFKGLFGGRRAVYRWSIGFTMVAAAVDFLNALPMDAGAGAGAAVGDPVSGAFTAALLAAKGAAAWAQGMLPLGAYGFGWVCPALLGAGLGYAISATGKARRKSAAEKE